MNPRTEAEQFTALIQWIATVIQSLRHSSDCAQQGDAASLNEMIPSLVTALDELNARGELHGIDMSALLAITDAPKVFRVRDVPPAIAALRRLQAFASMEVHRLAGGPPIANAKASKPPEIINVVDVPALDRIAADVARTADNTELLAADKLAMFPAEHYGIKYAITSDTLRKARESGRLVESRDWEKRGDRYFYRFASVEREWPQSVRTDAD